MRQCQRPELTVNPGPDFEAADTSRRRASDAAFQLVPAYAEMTEIAVTLWLLEMHKWSF